MIHISLCMIVKDEAAWLPKSLAAARAYADEAIVVDTGSGDDTAAIARSLGAKVAHFPWRDDFAAAKNRAIELAGGDWILFLDADEIIQGPNILREAAAAAGPATDALSLEILNYTSSNVTEIARVNRLFRNLPSLRYKGRVHEFLGLSSQRIEALPSVLRIHHYGYLQDEIERKDKIRRNLQLAEQAAAEETDPSRRNSYLFYTGREFQRQGLYREAVAAYSQALDSSALPDYILPLALRYRLRCLIELGRLDEALAETRQILRRYPDYTEVSQWQAALLGRAGRWQEAQRVLLAALKDPVHRPWLVAANHGIRALCWSSLGVTYAHLGQPRLAAQCQAKALSEDPPHREALPELVSLLKAMPPEELAGWLPGFLRAYPALQPLLEPELEGGS